MATTDPRVDAYISHAAAFAQPLLEHLRGVVHEAVPEVEETIKWGMPFFVTEDRMLCHMAAFKQHCAFGLWRGRGVVKDASDEAMGQFGRIRTRADLPTKKALIALLKKALREPIAKTPTRRARTPRPEAEVPDDLAAALRQKQHARARATFDAFPPGQRREYIDWITEAKREATRAQRLATTLAWLAEGKTRNWKYR